MTRHAAVIAALVAHISELGAQAPTHQNSRKSLDEIAEALGVKVKGAKKGPDRIATEACNRARKLSELDAEQIVDHFGLEELVEPSDESLGSEEDVIDANTHMAASLAAKEEAMREKQVAEQIAENVMSAVEKTDEPITEEKREEHEEVSVEPQKVEEKKVDEQPKVDNPEPKVEEKVEEKKPTKEELLQAAKDFEQVAQGQVPATVLNSTRRIGQWTLELLPKNAGFTIVSSSHQKRNISATMVAAFASKVRTIPVNLTVEKFVGRANDKILSELYKFSIDEEKNIKARGEFLARLVSIETASAKVLAKASGWKASHLQGERQKMMRLYGTAKDRIGNFKVALDTATTGDQHAANFYAAAKAFGLLEEGADLFGLDITSSSVKATIPQPPTSQSEQKKPIEEKQVDSKSTPTAATEPQQEKPVTERKAGIISSKLYNDRVEVLRKEHSAFVEHNEEREKKFWAGFAGHVQKLNDLLSQQATKHNVQAVSKLMASIEDSCAARMVRIQKQQEQQQDAPEGANQPTDESVKETVVSEQQQTTEAPINTQDQGGAGAVVETKTETVVETKADVKTEQAPEATVEVVTEETPKETSEPDAELATEDKKDEKKEEKVSKKEKSSKGNWTVWGKIVAAALAMDNRIVMWGAPRKAHRDDYQKALSAVKASMEGAEDKPSNGKNVGAVKALNTLLLETNGLVTGVAREIVGAQTVTIDGKTKTIAEWEGGQLEAVFKNGHLLKARGFLNRSKQEILAKPEAKQAIATNLAVKLTEMLQGKQDLLLPVLALASFWIGRSVPTTEKFGRWISQQVGEIKSDKDFESFVYDLNSRRSLVERLEKTVPNETSSLIAAKEKLAEMEKKANELDGDRCAIELKIDGQWNPALFNEKDMGLSFEGLLNTHMQKLLNFCHSVRTIDEKDPKVLNALHMCGVSGKKDETVDITTIQHLALQVFWLVMDMCSNSLDQSWFEVQCALRNMEALEVQSKTPNKRGVIKATAWFIYVGGRAVTIAVTNVGTWALRPVAAILDCVKGAYYAIRGNAEKRNAAFTAAWDAIKDIYRLPVSWIKAAWSTIAGKSGNTPADKTADNKEANMAEQQKKPATRNSITSQPWGAKRGTAWAEQGWAAKVVTATTLPFRWIARKAVDHKLETGVGLGVGGAAGVVASVAYGVGVVASIGIGAIGVAVGVGLTWIGRKIVGWWKGRKAAKATETATTTATETATVTTETAAAAA